ncbi:MAG: hypothetical protein ABIO31_08435 [Candidatus Nitrotoga sp.]
MRGTEELSGSVHISLVATPADGISLACTVIESTFNRLAFFHGLAIEPARVTDSTFSSTNTQPGHNPSHNIVSPGAGHIIITGFVPKVFIGISSATIQSELEQVGPSGEMHFSHIRSARLSVGPVEEFMHLYAILLIFHNDLQTKVDEFVVSIEPGVQQTQNPKTLKLETVYTRLRNEFSHKRGAVLRTTKLEMSKHLAGLHSIVQQAISQLS